MPVAGIGQCSLDYLALVDDYPPVDIKKEVLQWSEEGGGPVATALVTLSRLGIRCRFYGVIGDDDAGEKIRQSLIREGINTQGLLARNGATSQVAFIAIERKTARRTIFWRRPSGKPLRSRELPRDFLDGTHFLLLDGLMKDASHYAARRARRAGISVMLDAGRMRPGMLQLARLSDYVVASEEFAKDLGMKLTGIAFRRERERLGTRVLTVTRGEKGSMTVSAEGAFKTPAFATEAVDTTGAGDVFHGGYIHGLLNGLSLRNTVIFASAVAALKCGRIGGRAGIPRYREVMAFLRERGCSL